MKFNRLDTRMRAFETADDFSVPQRIYIVVRLDGRNFTTLTRKQLVRPQMAAVSICAAAKKPACETLIVGVSEHPER